MIEAQPAAIRATTASAARARSHLPAPRLDRPIYFVGQGTSFHAAIAGAFAARRRWPPSVAVEAWPSWEVATGSVPLDPHGFAIVYSAEGETALTAEAQRALRAAGVPQILITAVAAPTSSSRIADATFVTRGATEASWVHTVSYTAAVAATLELIGGWSRAGRRVGPELGRAVAGLVARQRSFRALAGRLRRARTFVLLGAGAGTATAREAALKVREGARRFATALGIEEFLHGALPSVDRCTAVLAVATTPMERARAREALTAARIAGAAGVLFARPPVASGEYGLPDVGVDASPVTDIVPFQCLVDAIAVQDGRMPDGMGLDDPRQWRARSSFGV